MKITKIFCIAAIALSPVLAQFTGTGVTALSIAPDARSAGLADANATFSGTLSSIFGNPAGLSSMKGMQIAGQYTMHIEGMHYGNVSWGMPLPFGAIGVNVIGFTYGDIPNYVEGVLSGSLMPFDVVANIGYAVPLSFAPILSNLSAGIVARVMMESLGPTYQGFGFAGDVGILWRGIVGAFVNNEWLNGIDLGVVARNLGVGPAFDGGKAVTLPMTIAIGLGYTLPLRDNAGQFASFRIPIDVLPISEIGFDMRYGVEFSYERLPLGMKISARAGAGLPYAGDILGTLRFGAGFEILGIAIQYAFVNKADLGADHAIGLSYRFDTVPLEAPKAVDTKPVDTKPLDTKPADKAGVKPLDTKPVDAKPVTTPVKPVTTTPVKPADTKPATTTPAKTGK
ncbi:MAG: PorV/PorQ family protein [Spirochaetota bacterium]